MVWKLRQPRYIAEQWGYKFVERRFYQCGPIKTSHLHDYPVASAKPHMLGSSLNRRSKACGKLKQPENHESSNLYSPVDEAGTPADSVAE
jgi:hypothetical protein